MRHARPVRQQHLELSFDGPVGAEAEAWQRPLQLGVPRVEAHGVTRIVLEVGVEGASCFAEKPRELTGFGSDRRHGANLVNGDGVAAQPQDDAAPLRG